MWRLLMNGFWQRKEKTHKKSFQMAWIPEETKELCNPSRGWYQLFTFVAGEMIDFDRIGSCLVDTESLVLVLIDIGSYRKSEPDNGLMEWLRSILSFFRDRKKEMILRITYDHEGKALEREPMLFSYVETHVRGLLPVLREFSSAVFVYQGMLVGNWGEMHGSRFMNQNHLERLAQMLESIVPEEVFLSVRRPVQWRMLHNCSDPEKLMKTQRMGIYDDAVFGSETDLGTFGSEARENGVWYAAWTRAEELAFVQKLCEHVPYGGEAVFGDGYFMGLSQGQILNDLKKMRLTYLNRLYDMRILTEWKRILYHGDGVWDGQSLYDYIGAHMGYRFVIRRAELAKSGKDEVLRLRIENSGFSRCFQKLELVLEWENEETKEQRMFELSPDILSGGQEEPFLCSVEGCSGQLYIRIQRKEDKMPVFFGNRSDSRGRVLIGSLN